MNNDVSGQPEIADIDEMEEPKGQEIHTVVEKPTDVDGNVSDNMDESHNLVEAQDDSIFNARLENLLNDAEPKTNSSNVSLNSECSHNSKLHHSSLGSGSSKLGSGSSKLGSGSSKLGSGSSKLGSGRSKLGSGRSKLGSGSSKLGSGSSKLGSGSSKLGSGSSKLKSNSKSLMLNPDSSYNAKLHHSSLGEASSKSNSKSLELNSDNSHNSKLHHSSLEEASSKSKVVSSSINFSGDQEEAKDKSVTNSKTVNVKKKADGSLVRSTRVLSSEELKKRADTFEGIEEKTLPNGTLLPDGMEIDGRFKILGVVGTGGFATVYRAHHLSIDRDIALKVMNNCAEIDSTYSERFIREAKIAAKIRHNNVVNIYDFGHIAETKQPYIAMELLHGRDLAQELAECGPLSPRRLYSLFRPVIDALGQGHHLGIVHKDLKPENLFIINPHSKHEAIKVLDFGVARVSSSKIAKLTGQGQLLGTPRYLAPEYIKDQTVSPAIDVYQMALIMSEALTGLPAVSGDAYHAVLMHSTGDLQMASFLLDGKIGEVFNKAIALKPEDRFRDCEEFGDALDGIADCFDSDFPLCGGDPQVFNRRTNSGHLTPVSLAAKKKSGEQSGNISENVSKSSSLLKKAVFVILIILLAACVGAGVFYFLNGQSFQLHRTNSVSQNNSSVTDTQLIFSFNTKPQGAQVKLNDTIVICDKTPCERSYKKGMFALPQSISFNLNGTVVETTICESDAEFVGFCTQSYEKTHGKIFMEIPQKVVPTLVKLKYVPETAKAFIGTKPVCEKSPCEFSLQCPAEDLRISLNGYVDFVKTSFCADVSAALEKSGNHVFEMSAELKVTANPSVAVKEQKSAQKPALPVAQKSVQNDEQEGQKADTPEQAAAMKLAQAAEQKSDKTNERKTGQDAVVNKSKPAATKSKNAVKKDKDSRDETAATPQKKTTSEGDITSMKKFGLI